MKTEILSCDICNRKYEPDLLNYEIIGMWPRHEGIGYMASKHACCRKHICIHCINGINDNLEGVRNG